ncbi:MAG: hypothetical protein BJ554DRAFT_6082, partial [Olpidium bornovanus]
MRVLDENGADGRWHWRLTRYAETYRPEPAAPNCAVPGCTRLQVRAKPVRAVPKACTLLRPSPQ